jgi:hypothetical protein
MRSEDDGEVGIVMALEPTIGVRRAVAGVRPSGVRTDQTSVIAARCGAFGVALDRIAACARIAWIPEVGQERRAMHTRKVAGCG